MFILSHLLEYDGKQRLLAGNIHADPGPDGKFGTNDDVTTSRMVFPCRGDRVEREVYLDPGPDGVWGTADDKMGARVIESGDRCASATCQPLLF